MIKSYLIMEKGLLEERVFPLEDRVSIGRQVENDIHLSDPSVSRRHAVVYLREDQAIVEDVVSKNGTFVNGKRVTRAVLSSGDVLKFGKVVFRFSQEEEEITHEKASLAETELLSQSETSESLDASPSRRSSRLIEAISKVPFFSSLNKAGLEELSRTAKLVVFSQGRTIIRQGDLGKSMYIILDGKVRVFTYDHQGKEIPLTILAENQSFGEISLLTGAPRTATVQAIEKTLLCRLSFEAMRVILQKFPVIKGTLEEYNRERLKDMEAKKRAAGFVERRRHPRYNVKLPVSLSISTTSSVSDHFKGKVFRSTSVDLSISGIRIKALDRSLLGVPVGCQLRLEISFPRPWGPIRCLGTLRNIVESKECEEFGYLGIEFAEMSPDHRKKLNLTLHEISGAI